VSCAARAHARLPGVFHGRAAGGAGRQSGQAGFGGQDRRFGRAVSPCLEVFSGSSGPGNVESIEKYADSLAARGGHAVPAGALRAALHAVAAAPVWLAAVFAVAGLIVIPLTRTVAGARRATSAG
jgi:hypothetical protein